MNKKEAAYTAFRELLEQDITNTDRFRATAQFDANEAEGRMISRYDTFKEEAQFLAAGQEKRKLEREVILAILDRIRNDCLAACTKVLSGAIIEIENEEGNIIRYYMIPGGSGKKITIQGKEYICISPESPLGKALLGKSVNDEARMVVNKKSTYFVVTNIE